MLGIETRPFPNPLTKAAGSTVIDLAGETLYAETIDDLPPLFREVGAAYKQALEDHAQFSALQAAIKARDAALVKELWNPIAQTWDDRSFTTLSPRPMRSKTVVPAPRSLWPGRFRHRRVGQ